MWMTFVKVLVSAGVISVVSGLAKMNPKLGGMIAALPLVSILSAFWLMISHQPSNDIAGFLSSVTKGLIPTAVLLICMIICLRNHVPFLLALAVGVGVWVISNFGLQRLGW